MIKAILFFKAIDRRDTGTADMFGTHLETHTRKDGVVQTYHVSAPKKLSKDDANRALGDAWWGGKNKGQKRVDHDYTGNDDGSGYIETDFPLDKIMQNEAGDRYDGTADAARVKEYAGKRIDAPVHLLHGERAARIGMRHAGVMDGGHRVSAARLRGDSHIRAIMQQSHYDRLMGTTPAHGEKSLQASRDRIKDYKDSADEADAAGKDSGFYRHLLSLAEPSHRDLEQVVGHFRKHGDGLQLRHKTQDKWAMLLPDASEHGKYRYQRYDKDGFAGHQAFKDVDGALSELAQDGYHVEDNGSLDRLAATKTWQRGMEVNAVIQASNAKQITWQDANKQIAEIDAKYAEPAVEAKTTAEVIENKRQMLQDFIEARPGDLNAGKWHEQLAALGGKIEEKKAARTAVDQSGWSLQKKSAYALKQEYEKSRVDFLSNKGAATAFKAKVRALAKRTPASDDGAVMLLDNIATKMDIGNVETGRGALQFAPDKPIVFAPERDNPFVTPY